MSKRDENNHPMGDMELIDKMQYHFSFEDPGHMPPLKDYSITYADTLGKIKVGDPNYKFNEGALIDEFREYINSTYDSHYSKEKFQATEFIIDGGHGTGFCIGNVLKYAQRYGKKGTKYDARKDLMKVLHYALIQLSVHDSE